MQAVVGRILLVEFSQLNREKVSLKERYLQSMDYILVIIWPAFIGMAVLAKPIITILYGERWLPAVVPFVLLAVGSFVAAPLMTVREIFTSKGELATQSRIELVRGAVLIVTFILGCYISLEAAAGARVIDGVLAYVLYQPHINRLIDIKGSEIWPIYARGAALTFLAVLPASLFATLGNGSAEPLMLLCAICSGVALWTVGLILFAHPLGIQLMRESRRVMRRIVHGTVTSSK
jgi:O-antigen/teichoic acid export membrane protein